MISKTEQFHINQSTNTLYLETMSTIKRLASEKGELMLGYEGYIYTKERKNDEKIIFRCKNRGCKGKSNRKKNIFINFSY